MNDHTRLTGTCPVCNGSARIAAPDDRYKTVYSGYDAAANTLPCKNCGGQTMYGRATGQVPLRPDGTLCQHSYISRNAGRCYTIYTCEHCSHYYNIDSSD